MQRSTALSSDVVSLGAAADAQMSDVAAEVTPDNPRLADLTGTWMSRSSIVFNPEGGALTATDGLEIGQAVATDGSGNVFVAGGSSQNVMKISAFSFFGLDDFKCHKTRDLENPKFTKVEGLTVEDQFGSDDDVSAIKPFLVCAPADLGEGVFDPEAHLCCYKAKGAKLDPAVQVRTEDAFGILEFELKKPAMLCRPCSKAVLP